MKNADEAAVLGDFGLSPEHLALALAAGQLGLWQYDFVSGSVVWSPGLERIHGLEIGTFEGTFEAYQRDMHPEDRERVLATIGRSVQGEEPHELEYRIIRPDGAVRWLSARGRLAHDSDGRPARLLGICMDVTERKETELALRVSERWFSTVVTSIGDGVVTTDAKGAVTLMNPASEQLACVRFAEVKGRPVTEVLRLIDEETREPIENPVERVLRENRVVGLANHTLLLRPDGTEIAIDDSAAPIRFDDGTIVGVVMVFSDVTTKRLEARRRDFAAEATALLAESLDLETTLATVARLAVPRIADWCAVDLLSNGGALERVGVAHVDPSKVALAHELHRRYPPDLAAPHGVANVLRTGKPELLSDIPDELFVAAARDAEHLRILRSLGLRSAMVVPVRHRGEVLGAMTFVGAEQTRRLDELDLRLAQELANCAAIAISNARLYAEAQRNVQAREDFLAMVSHDLRNPLNVIMMKAALLERRTLEPGAAALRGDIDSIRRSGARMERLIRDLLDFARIDAGQLSLETEPCDAEAIIVQAVEGLLPLAGEKSIQVERDGAAEGLTLVCDRHRVLQLLENLLANAVRFTPPRGTITIGVAAQPDELLFAVRDTGPGIDEAHCERLFDRYWRARDQKSEGLGLGLFIAKGIAEAHGGRIWVESARGQGACFRFAMPLGRRHG